MSRRDAISALGNTATTISSLRDFFPPPILGYRYFVPTGLFGGITRNSDFNGDRGTIRFFQIARAVGTPPRTRKPKEIPTPNLRLSVEIVHLDFQIKENPCRPLTNCYLILTTT